MKNANIDDMDKKKFLIPSDLNVGQLMWVIRKRIKLQYDKALFLHVSRTIPHSRYFKQRFFSKHFSEFYTTTRCSSKGSVEDNFNRDQDTMAPNFMSLLKI